MTKKPLPSASKICVISGPWAESLHSQDFCHKWKKNSSKCMLLVKGLQRAHAVKGSMKQNEGRETALVQDWPVFKGVMTGDIAM